jgi:hypothetical protein
MTKLLEKAVALARALSPEAQDEIAKTILDLTGNEAEPEAVPPEHLAAVLEGLAQAADGRFSTDAEVEAAMRHFEK